MDRMPNMVRLDAALLRGLGAGGRLAGRVCTAVLLAAGLAAGQAHPQDPPPPVTEPAAAVAAGPSPLTGFAAGATGAALLVAGVWGLHMLSPAKEGVGAVVLLLVAVTALGKGITLLQRVLTPITTAAAVAASGVPASVRALSAIAVGAAGVWWVLRGDAAFSRRGHARHVHGIAVDHDAAQAFVGILAHDISHGCCSLGWMPARPWRR